MIYMISIYLTAIFDFQSLGGSQNCLGALECLANMLLTIPEASNDFSIWQKTASFLPPADGYDALSLSLSLSLSFSFSLSSISPLIIIVCPIIFVTFFVSLVLASWRRSRRGRSKIVSATDADRCGQSSDIPSETNLVHAKNTHKIHAQLLHIPIWLYRSTLGTVSQKKTMSISTSSTLFLLHR